ncbi:acyl-CoA N-acyltransferase [Xylaria sp. FL1777]|nr:acyl-CoA N-acyltransferase [Xylaria sp. FL1777]
MESMMPTDFYLSEVSVLDAAYIYTELLEYAFEIPQESFVKACTADGTAVGFCGWTVIERNYGRQLSLLAALREERNRVLGDLDNICRLTLMAVTPKYQRRGIGSMMMRQVCKEIDRHRRSAYVLAAPEVVPPYTKFGFEIAGLVKTARGVITSMFRPSRHPC